MKTRAKYGSGPRNLAAISLLGHVGGAALLGLICLMALYPLAIWGAFAGGALGGAAGAGIGLLVLVDERPRGDHKPPMRPWLAILAGALASVLVTGVSLALEFDKTGFLDGSPCQELSGGRGPHMETVQTLIPVQYTCLYSGGVLPLIPPVVLAVLSIVALIGAASIAWGLWALRPRETDDGPETRIDTVLVVLAVVVGIFLVVDGVLGASALLAPAGIGS